jgi:hypothetical protein
VPHADRPQPRQLLSHHQCTLAKALYHKNRHCCCWLCSTYAAPYNQQLYKCLLLPTRACSHPIHAHDTDPSMFWHVVQVLGSLMAGTQCYRQSYGRGAGTFPTACSPGWQFSVGLCYEACRAGWTPNNFLCWENCKSGWTDHGATCHIPMYTVSASGTCPWYDLCGTWVTGASWGGGGGVLRPAVLGCASDQTARPIMQVALAAANVLVWMVLLHCLLCIWSSSAIPGCCKAAAVV